MNRQTYQRQLDDLQAQVTELGETVVRALDRSLDALARGDHELARAVIAGDAAVDGRRAHIEVAVCRLLATQQPVASDLRAIIATMHIASELERIGDYAMTIARTTLRHERGPLLAELPVLAAGAQQMLRRALDAVVRLDPDAARAVANDDDEVDAAYEQLSDEWIARMQADPQLVASTVLLLRACHSLERTADRATNICEQIVYEVTGQTVALNHAPPPAPAIGRA